MQPLCDQNCILSVADQSATGRRQISPKIGDQSASGRRLVAIDCQLIGNGLRLVGNSLATGRRQVGDELAIDYGTNNLLLGFSGYDIHRLRPYISNETVSN